MITASTRRADLQRTIAECAADIVANFQREDISTNVAIAIVATVVVLLTDDLPADQRATFLRAYAADLLRTQRPDA